MALRMRPISISFFSTTSDLNRRRALLLPRDLSSTGSYDFLKAGLSSSAWAEHGLRLFFALLVYGFALGFLARALRVRA